MSEKLTKYNEGLEFERLASVAEFESALAKYKGTERYETVVEYRELAALQNTSSDMFVVISLLKDALNALTGNNHAGKSADLINTVEDYHRRLQNTLMIVSKDVPNHMHFVWVGGAAFGANQRDYFNIWKAQAPKDFTFNIWYDPEALMAFDVSRTIIQAAKADAMVSAGDKVLSQRQLRDAYESRLFALRREATRFTAEAQRRGFSPDEARIEFLVEAFGQDRPQLQAARARYLQSHLDMVAEQVQLRNAREAFQSHFLWSAYDREISLRGNFAAASDIVRLQVESLEGGVYSDLDYLPPLAKEMAGVDVAGLGKNARVGVLQLLLNHNETLMPGRSANRYQDYLKYIPKEHYVALENFAKSRPSFSQIFAPVVAQATPLDIVGLGSPFDDNGSPPSLMNAFIAAHPHAGMTTTTMEVIRYYYDVIEAVEKELNQKGIAWSDDRNIEIIQRKLRETRSPFAGSEAPEQIWRNYETKIVTAIFTYHHDGVVPGAQGTIALTGPGALTAGSDLFTARQYTERGVAQAKNQQYLRTGYNAATEEDAISGWTERDDADGKWVQDEMQAWRDGKFKARYASNLAELLKPANTLTFKRGWPVVAGKPVLVTAILQRLIDDLGEPFVRAMTDKLSGEVVFDRSAELTYQERRQVDNQTVTDLPDSVGAQRAGNLNELLVHLARDTLPIEQLSPLQRTVLAGLFGAASVDSVGFAKAWDAARKLARDTAEGGVFGRFAAIEDLLHQRQMPVSNTAVAETITTPGHSSRELKALALTELMTLSQWRQRVAQVHRTAQWEYRTRILNRAGGVREQFFRAGAISARQIPQALLQTPGDPGRRCYPLALLMAAAMTRGENAERALIGRVANASLAPQEPDSRALLLALDELRGVPMARIGKPLGAQTLPMIMQTLLASTASSVLLLDTGNHALLVAKIVTGDASTFRFFEPNVAAYGFAEQPSLQHAIEGYLNGDGGELAKLYGLAEASNSKFTVLQLNTAAIADQLLPSSVKVSKLLENTPITGAESITVWEKQSALRTRLLSENSRMGDSLTLLEARHLAQEFELATRQLRSEYSLGGEYLPLLNTVKTTADDHYSLTVVDALRPDTTVTVKTTDARFFKIRRRIQRAVEAVVGKHGAPGESDGGSRLSFAFAIQTLVTEMRSREYQAADDPVPALSVALQVQVYVSYAQLSYGVVTDAVQVINLVRQVAASERALVKQQASLSGRVVGRVAAPVGIGFSLVNIGFDIHGLTVATNQEQRSRLATQLVFNVAALALDITALAVGGTVGAAASILSVPLLGVGIGVTAIASNLGAISDKARAVGRHLLMIHTAYGPEGCQIKDGALTFAGEAIITHLDLKARRVRFDSQKFFPTQFATVGLPSYNTNPADLHHAVNIRQALSREDTLEFGKADIQVVVLPCTPLCYYGYEYQLGSSGFAPDDDLLQRLSESRGIYEPLTPGETDGGLRTSYPNILDVWKEQLEFPHGEQRLQLFSTAPFPHILYKLLPVNKPTTITVQLDAHARYLLIPELPKEWHHLLSFDISADSGLSQLTLTPGVTSVRLRQSLPVGSESLEGWKDTVSWLIRAPWVSDQEIEFDRDDLIVDGIRVIGFTGLIQLKGGELFQFNREKNAWLLLSITMDKSPPSGSLMADRAPMLERLRSLAETKRTASGFVPIYNFAIPFELAATVKYGTGYYAVAEQRILYARDLPESLAQAAVLAAVSGDKAWFYHPDAATVWRVDATTGQVKHAYRLMSPRRGAKIIAAELTAHGQLRVVQEKASGEQTRFTLEYLIAENTVTFVHCNAFETVWRDDMLDIDYWKEPLQRFRLPDTKLDEINLANVPMSHWTSADFVGLRGHHQDSVAISGWTRLSDYRFYFNDDPGQDEPVQRILLACGQSDAEAVMVYDVANTSLVRGFTFPQQGEYRPDEILENEIGDVSLAQGRYIVTKADGQMFELAKDGALAFIGVGKRWLDRHPDWLGALPALVAERGRAPFPVIGLADCRQNASLAVWSCDNRLLVGQSGLGEELQVLGMTPDGQAAWLFNVDEAQLYRQPLMTAESARQAFAGGTRLVNPQSLPVAQRVWPEWSFAKVEISGQGLLGQTRDGVNLQLVDQQPARIVGVENHWARAEQAGIALKERLQNLLSAQVHAPVLTIENQGDSYTYYVPEQDHLFSVNVRQYGQWAVLLGVQHAKESLLFDPVDGLVLNRGSKNAIWLTDSHAQREGDVLTLESQSEVNDLMPLMVDGVDKLILAFGRLTQRCRVSNEVWQRLDCLVIDRRHSVEQSPSIEHTLVLEMAGLDRLMLSEAGANLLLIDPNSAHTLIVLNPDPEDAQGRVPLYLAFSLVGRDYKFNIEQLRDGLGAQKQSSVDLKMVINLLSG